MLNKLAGLFMGLACALVAGLSSRAAAQANPGLPFYGYGSIVANPAFPVVNENTHITVAVGNTGPVANNGEAALDLLVLGHAVRDAAGGGVPGDRAEPIDLLLHLEPGETVEVPVVADLNGLPPGTPVEYLLEAFDLARPADPTAKEHVLLRIVRAPARDLKARVADELAAVAAGLPRGAAANQFRAALKHLRTALEPRLWLDADRVHRGRGAEVFAIEGSFHRKAVELLPSLPYGAKVAVEGALRALLDCDRILAQTAIGDADGDPEAEALLEQADASRLAGDGGAILLYKRAWQAATR
jgi:hypothetical protein